MELSYKLTREEYWQFVRALYKRRGAYRRNFLVFGVVTVGTVLILGLTSREPASMVMLTAAAAALLVVPYALLCLWMGRRRVMKIPAEGGSILGERTMRIGPEGVFVKTQCIEGLTQWSGILDIVETPQFIGLFVDTHMAHVIPRRVFPDAAAAHNFLALTRSFWKKPTVQLPDGPSAAPG